MIRKGAMFAGLLVLCTMAAGWAAGERQAAGSASPITTEAKMVVKDMQGNEIKLQPGEKIVFLFLEAVSSMEDDCRRHLNRPCPLEELVKGAKAPDGNIGKLKFDPATDANYKYTITISGRSWEARAIPRHEGFGGVFYDGSTTIPHSYYNSNGPATSDNTRLGEIQIVGDTFKIR